MKRLHVHIAVSDLDSSIRFYSQLFAADPTVRRSDYAKWMLEDPRVNFALSQRGAKPGIQELGIQAETRTELEELYERLTHVQRPVFEEGATTCCYARSEKSWVTDPQGQEWEIFLTSGESTTYGADKLSLERVAEPDCCAPSCCTPAAP